MDKTTGILIGYHHSDVFCVYTYILWQTYLLLWPDVRVISLFILVSSFLSFVALGSSVVFTIPVLGIKARRLNDKKIVDLVYHFKKCFHLPILLYRILAT